MGSPSWGFILVAIICSFLMILLGLAVGTTVFYGTSMAEDQHNATTITSTEENLSRQLETVPSKLL